MQRLIETQRAALAAFLEQRDKGVLVLRAPGEQIGYAIQFLKSIEDSGSPDVFFCARVCFARPVCVAGSRTREGERACRACGAWRQSRGSTSHAPGLRGRRPGSTPAAPHHSRVCALASASEYRPANRMCLSADEHSDPPGYGRLMMELIQPEGVPPSDHFIRFILREDTIHPCSVQYFRCSLASRCRRARFLARRQSRPACRKCPPSRCEHGATRSGAPPNRIY